MFNRYQYIEDWKEDDLSSLPSSETDVYEYKSSRTSKNSLKDKIAVAASAFWNSGGGIFIGGVNDEGKIDGGMPLAFGRQKIRDWIDQALATVEPIGPYVINIITKSHPHSCIDDDGVVIVIGFGESLSLPHMAPDNRYYIRAGAHSGPASHFVIEALRSKRGIQAPILRGVFQEHPQKLGIVQLVVTSINQNTALDVSVNFDPVPVAVSQVMSGSLPLTIPIISKEIPFIMDIAIFGDNSAAFGSQPVQLSLEYSDFAGNRYNHTQSMHPRSNYSPLSLRTSTNRDPQRSLIRIADALEQIMIAIRQSKNENTNPT